MFKKINNRIIQKKIDMIDAEIIAKERWCGELFEGISKLESIKRELMRKIQLP